MPWTQIARLVLREAVLTALAIAGGLGPARQAARVNAEELLRLE